MIDQVYGVKYYHHVINYLSAHTATEVCNSTSGTCSYELETLDFTHYATRADGTIRKFILFDY